jgi:hypothetical protein
MAARTPLIRLVFALVAVFSAGAGRLAADLAQDLARISVEAAGGMAAHRGLKSFLAEGVTRVGEHEVNFILYAARPNRLRIETIGEKGSLVRGYDGVHAPWKKDALLAPPRRLGREEEREFLLDADFDNPLFDSARRGISLDYAGEAVVDGRPCRKLLAIVRHTDALTLYVDDETRLVTRRDQTKKVRGREVVIETHYSGFQATKGVLLPRRIRTVVEGRVLNDTRIQAIDPNPGFAPDFFAPPVKDWPTQ